MLGGRSHWGGRVSWRFTLMDDEIKNLRDATIDTQVDIENLRLEMASFKGETYQPKYNFEELYKLKNSTDKRSLQK